MSRPDLLILLQRNQKQIIELLELNMEIVSKLNIEPTMEDIRKADMKARFAEKRRESRKKVNRK